MDQLPMIESLRFTQTQIGYAEGVGNAGFFLGVLLFAWAGVKLQDKYGLKSIFKVFIMLSIALNLTQYLLDKALFDHGLLGLKRVKGYDLEDLGSRAYRIASEALELLAEDRRLREFFRQNPLLVLPLEEEVVFLRQCSERFPTYASILKRIQSGSAPGPLSGADEIRSRVPLMAAAAEVLSAEAEAPREACPPPHRDELIAAYERMALFGSVDLERLRASLRALVVDQDPAMDAL